MLARIVVFVVQLSVPVLASGANQYVATPLGSLGGGWAYGADINADGHVVGRARTASGEMRAFVYASAGMIDLGIAAPFSSAVAINEAGDIAGERERDDGPIEGFLVSGGTLIILPSLGAGASLPYAVNASGQAVGYSWTGRGVEMHAFVYYRGIIQDLGTLGGTHSFAYAISGSGLVVGASLPPGDGTSHAFRASGGRMEDLGTLPGTTISSAVGVNDLGQAVGSSWFTDENGTRAVMWSEGAIVDLGTLGGRSASASGINNHGQVVGTSTVAGDAESHAFLYEQGVMRDLNALVTAGLDGATLTSAVHLNDAGQIVANACSGSSFDVVCHAFRLDPQVPPDAAARVPIARGWLALAVMGVALIGMAAARRT